MRLPLPCTPSAKCSISYIMRVFRPKHCWYEKKKEMSIVNKGRSQPTGRASMTAKMTAQNQLQEGRGVTVTRACASQIGFLATPSFRQTSASALCREQSALCSFQECPARSYSGVVKLSCYPLMTVFVRTRLVSVLPGIRFRVANGGRGCFDVARTSRSRSAFAPPEVLGLSARTYMWGRAESAARLCTPLLT